MVHRDLDMSDVYADAANDPTLDRDCEEGDECQVANCPLWHPRDEPATSCEDFPCCGHEMGGCNGRKYGSDESIKARALDDMYDPYYDLRDYG